MFKKRGKKAQEEGAGSGWIKLILILVLTLITGFALYFIIKGILNALIQK